MRIDETLQGFCGPGRCRAQVEGPRGCRRGSPSDPRHIAEGGDLPVRRRATSPETEIDAERKFASPRRVGGPRCASCASSSQKASGLCPKSAAEEIGLPARRAPRDVVEFAPRARRRPAHRGRTTGSTPSVPSKIEIDEIAERLCLDARRLSGGRGSRTSGSSAKRLIRNLIEKPFLSLIRALGGGCRHPRR